MAKKVKKRGLTTPRKYKKGDTKKVVKLGGGTQVKYVKDKSGKVVAHQVTQGTTVKPSRAKIAGEVKQSLESGKKRIARNNYSKFNKKVLKIAGKVIKPQPKKKKKATKKK